MNRDADNLKHLLTVGHISMSERESLHIWPHEPISFTALISFLADIVVRDRYFTKKWSDQVEGELVSEQMVNEKTNKHYLVHARRHDPIFPTIVSEDEAKKFSSAEYACAY